MADVKLKNIVKKYIDKKSAGRTYKRNGFVAVKNFNLEIKDKEFIIFVGPSGCGKSTTLRMIAGLEDISNGELYIDDKLCNTVSPKDRDIAMVFQNYALYPTMTVRENIEFGLENKKVPKEERKKRVQEICEVVGLTQYLDRKPATLSGGQRQRVALARAMVKQPKVFLMDEPLSNLDAKLRVTMRTEIRKIQQKVGITAIYVTHDQSEAMSISDKIIIMSKGKVEQIGTPREIYYHPKSRFVADFIGEANFLKAKVKSVNGEKAGIDVIGEEIEVNNYGEKAAGEEASLVLRPEAVVLSEKGLLEGTVTLSTFMGSYQYYQVMVGDMEIQITDYNPVNRRIYEVGEKAYLDFDPHGVYIL